MADFDFDQSRRARPDGFIIAGERFAMTDPGYQETAKWQDGGSGGSDEDDEEVGQAAADAETVEFIEKFIDPSDHARWRALQTRETDRLTRGDILGLARWLFEQHTERPTMLPSSSGRGQIRVSGGSGGGPPSQGSTREG